MSDYLLVEQPDTIRNDLAGHERIGVDTEFMRESTFFAELCLVQIATDEQIFCVDPLVDEPMRTFWETATSRTWVIHSARQDIEVIYQSSERMPAAIFDTQVAAGLIGYAPQLGYANLVTELFDVELPKTHTRADWSKRPLGDALLQYAAEDVQFLLPAFEILAERLDKKNRLAWAHEDSAALLDPGLYDIDPEQAIDRLKGARNLRGRRRAAAARLAAWRESEALRSNRPRQWIARDTLLIDLATELPTSIDALHNVEGLPAGLVRRRGSELLEAIAASGNDNNNYRPPTAPNEAQKSVLKKMQTQVAECAGDLGLAAETVASKRDLSAIITGGDQESRLLTGWRQELIGDRLLELV